MCLLLPALLLGEKLGPTERGVPAELGGEAGLEQRGAYLWLTARLPEPGGKVLARSIGRNPVWEKDAMESPDVEDRVRWRIRYRSSGGVQRDLSVEVNPWGAYRTEEAGRITKDLGLSRSAEVTADGWNVEASIPLQTLDLDWNSASVAWRAERIRSRRALAPEFQWQWPAGSEFANLKLTKNATDQPPLLRQVARRQRGLAGSAARCARDDGRGAPARPPRWRDAGPPSDPGHGGRRDEGRGDRPGAHRPDHRRTQRPRRPGRPPPDKWARRSPPAPGQP